MSELRWNCQKYGKCFVEYKHVKLEVFDEDLPRNCQASDVDFVADDDGRFLFQEWKDACHNELHYAHHVLFENLSKLPGVSCCAVFGNAKTMEVERIQVFHNGKALEQEDCDLNGLKDRVRKWGRTTKKPPGGGCTGG